MQAFRNLEYVINRIEQCRRSACNAKNPDVKALHLQFIKLYEKELQQNWTESKMHTAPCGERMHAQLQEVDDATPAIEPLAHRPTDPA